MFCKNCGAYVADDDNFCNACGTPVEKPEAAAAEETVYEEPVYEEPVYEAPEEQPAYEVPETPVYEAPVQTPVYTAPAQTPVNAAPARQANHPDATKTMILGIVSLVCSCSISNIAGIICGAIALKLSKGIQKDQGTETLTGKAKVGKILGTIGLILGIVSAALVVLAIIAEIVMWILAATVYAGAAATSLGSDLGGFGELGEIIQEIMNELK